MGMSHNQWPHFFNSPVIPRFQLVQLMLQKPNRGVSSSNIMVSCKPSRGRYRCPFGQATLPSTNHVDLNPVVTGVRPTHCITPTVPTPGPCVDMPVLHALSGRQAYLHLPRRLDHLLSCQHLAALPGGCTEWGGHVNVQQLVLVVAQGVDPPPQQPLPATPLPVSYKLQAQQ
jgi:hypothetical protein